MRKLWTLALLFSLSASAISLEEIKMRKRFGIGAAAAGPHGLFGAEVDVNITPECSVGLGMGTGVEYRTAMAKIRYFLPGEWVSPYLAVGAARWWADRAAPERLSPPLLVDQFIPGGNTQFDVVLVYPALGVQFMQSTGVSFFAEVQYLFQLFDFRNALYAGAGVHWYL